MIKYPKYYRKEGKCIRRINDTTGTQVLTPERAEDRLPLSVSKVVFPDKARFDESVKEMEETDESMFDSYMKRFTGLVDIYIKFPMAEIDIKKELAKLANQQKFSRA